MKTLVKMKITKMGKDDDTAITVKYNEGGEYKIGPDLLKAFKNLKAVDILDPKKEAAEKEAAEKKAAEKKAAEKKAAEKKAAEKKNK